MNAGEGMSGTITVTHNLGEVTTQSLYPVCYRLGVRNGTYVLQGMFTWQQGDIGGQEWRDIPTIVLEPSDEPASHFQCPHLWSAVGADGYMECLWCRAKQRPVPTTASDHTVPL